MTHHARMHLGLRTPNRRDRRFHARIYGDAILMRAIEPPLPPRAALRNAERAISRRRHERLREADWIVQVTRRRAGVAGWRRHGNRLELGIILLPEWQGQGLAVPVMRLLLEKATGLPGVDVLLIRHHPGNARMAAVARALGFLPQSGAECDGMTWCLARERGSACAPDGVS
jgi:RimJ/RimL family protein N-acetyltransferase